MMQFYDPFDEASWMLGEKFSRNFVRGASRLMVADTEVAEQISDVGEILVLEPGENQYDTQPWILDFATVRAGIDISWQLYGPVMVKADLSEMRPDMLIREDVVSEMGHVFGLFAAFQTPEGRIRVYCFPRVQMGPMEYSMFGEISQVVFYSLSQRGQDKIMESR